VEDAIEKSVADQLFNVVVTFQPPAAIGKTIRPAYSIFPIPEEREYAQDSFNSTTGL